MSLAIISKTMLHARFLKKKLKMNVVEYTRQIFLKEILVKMAYMHVNVVVYIPHIHIYAKFICTND